MASFVIVAKVADVPEGSAKMVEAGGKQIALFNAGGKFYAVDNTCKHRGGPLAEGELDGTTVACPWHGWEYDITTGANLDDPGVKLGCYAVKAEGDDILVEA
jgi:nitrite reductase (NADH) small subunit